MPRVDTIEDTFEYNIKRILKQTLRDWKEADEGLSFLDYAWKYANEIGKTFLTQAEEYTDVDELMETKEN